MVNYKFFQQLILIWVSTPSISLVIWRVYELDNWLPGQILFGDWYDRGCDRLE